MTARIQDPGFIFFMTGNYFVNVLLHENRISSIF